jgi:glycerate dehydrogenase
MLIGRRELLVIGARKTDRNLQLRHDAAGVSVREDIMKLVYLDAHTIDPSGDLSWSPLRECGAELVLYPRTSPNELKEHADGAELLITNKVCLDAEILRSLPQLKYAGVIATGFDVVDVGVARELGITVTNVPSYGTNAVAQHTFALLLEVTNRVQDHATTVRNGEWSRSTDWCY